jgi:hypothetical protein
VSFSSRACRRREWCVPAKVVAAGFWWGRSQFGAKPQYTPRREVPRVQATRPRIAVMQSGVFPTASLQFTFTTASRRVYPKRYMLISEWIVPTPSVTAISKKLRNTLQQLAPEIFGTRSARSLATGHRLRAQRLVAAPGVAAWGLRRSKFSCPHCLSAVLQEIHDEPTGGA